MKKNLFYLFMLMAIVAMPLTSCDGDEPQTGEESKHDPVADDDQMEFVGYSGLEWLQSNIVVVDENNEVLRRIYGKPLDESMPTVVSVPVADYADAEKIFLSWVAPTKEATKVDGGYDYNLTDAEGNAEGSVSFRAVEGEAGVIARMSVAEGTALKQVSEVNFIDAELWPENTEYPVYEAGKIYMLEGERYEWIEYEKAVNGKKTDFRIVNEELAFYCLRGNNNGGDALLVWLSPEDLVEWEKVGDRYERVNPHPTPSKYHEQGLNYRLSTLPELLAVMNFYATNYDVWQKMLDEMESKGYKWKPASGWFNTATGNSEFLFGGSTDGKTFPCLDLDNKEPELDAVSINGSFYQYRYMHVRIVPAR